MKTIEEFFGRTDVERKLVAGDVIQVVKRGFKFTICSFADGIALVDFRDFTSHRLGILECNRWSTTIADVMKFYETDYIRIVNTNEVYTKHTPKKLKVGMHVFERGNEYIISSFVMNRCVPVDLNSGKAYGSYVNIGNQNDISKHEFLKMFSTDAKICE